MKVDLLDGGHFTAPAGVWRRDDDMDRQVRFPVPVYLIETATERILVDTGLHPEAVADPQARYGDPLTLFALELDRTLAEQVDLSTVTKVIVTHLHFDHAGGLDLPPPSVPVYVQRREWEAARNSAAAARNHFRSADYSALDDRVVLVDGDHDLLGDGSIELLLTRGHTPGHQSVRVGETLVIGGDVTHFATGLDDHRFPIFADDFAAQAESAERPRELRDAGAEVLPGHDPAVLTPGCILPPPAGGPGGRASTL